GRFRGFVRCSGGGKRPLPSEPDRRDPFGRHSRGPSLSCSLLSCTSSFLRRPANIGETLCARRAQSEHGSRRSGVGRLADCSAIPEEHRDVQRRLPGPYLRRGPGRRKAVHWHGQTPSELWPVRPAGSGSAMPCSLGFVTPRRSWLEDSTGVVV